MQSTDPQPLPGAEPVTPPDALPVTPPLEPPFAPVRVRRARKPRMPRGKRPLTVGSAVLDDPGSRTRRRRSVAHWRSLLPAVIVVAVFAVTAVILRDPPVGSPRTAVVVANAAERTVPAPPPKPTPILAGYRGLQLDLPVPAKSLSGIAFHQASYSNAQNMTALWKGKVHQLYRTGRSGPPNTAIDVGAAPGTPVLAPVSGVVVEVRPYQLYGKYDDVQIHIKPAGWVNLEAVLIHITDPSVKVGDEVVGGVTPVAKVRKLSDRMHMQLDDYTHDGGNHVHVQLNAWPATATPAPVSR